MEPTFSQPNGAPIDKDLVARILGRAVDDSVTPDSFELINYDQYSNDLAVATLKDDRRLVVKRGRYEWSRSALENSRRGAELLHARGILAPRALELPPEALDEPIQAYWRIELPTLMELWPALSGVERERAIRSLGRLMQRTHSVQLGGHGLLVQEDPARQPFAAALMQELREGLMPAVLEVWPVATPLVTKLLDTLPAVADRAPPDGVLVHGDLHLGNVLCSIDDDGPRCVGLIDLEWVHAAPKENDIARLSVIQTRLFQMPIEEDWMPWFLAGYDMAVDPLVFRFYRLYHLVQLGLHSASLGHDVHAEDVAAAAAAELKAWGAETPRSVAVAQVDVGPASEVLGPESGGPSPESGDAEREPGGGVFGIAGREVHARGSRAEVGHGEALVV